MTPTTTRSLRMIALASCLALTVSACGTKPSPYHSGNYPGKLKIGTPYKIDGRVYTPKYEPNYQEVGVASWYGPGFHGRSTANGERFDQHAMTAAHRTMPLPSMAKVTNLENGKSIVVKVNDRGPFKKDRIIDLSKEAATQIGMIGKGTAEVRVEYLPQESKDLIRNLVQNNKLDADAKSLAVLGIKDITIPSKVAMASAAAAAPVKKAEAPGKMAKMGGFFSKLNPFGTAKASEPVKMANKPVQLDEVPEAERVIDSSQQTAFAAPARAEASAVPTKPVQSRDLTAPTQDLLGDQMVPSTTPPAPMPQAEVTSEKEMQVAAVSQQAARATVEEMPVAGMYVQVGSFSQPDNARSLAEKLSSVGRATVKPVEVNGRTWYRVRLGPIENTDSANNALNTVMRMGINDARVVYD